MKLDRPKGAGQGGNLLRKEQIETAKTVEEAINAACAKLGYERDQVEWEIIDLPRKTFLGLKTIPAKVKIWVDVPDPVSRPEPAQRRESRPQEESRKRPVQDRQPKKEPQPAQIRAKTPEIVEMTPEIQKKADIAIQYLRDVCAQMGLFPQFSARIEDGGLLIEVRGEGLGAMIGRRGETLDALQYLSSLVANRLEGDYLRLTVDCGDYRAKRRTTLEALAKKLSAQVLKTNTSKTLEPMNPFERRIIHATVAEIEGVSSTSVGEEPNRRVVITTPSARPPRPARGVSRDGARRRDGAGPRDSARRSSAGRPPRRDGGRRTGNAGTQGGTINTLPQTRNITPAGTRPAEPKKTPEAEAGNALYSKLDLE